MTLEPINIQIARLTKAVDAATAEIARLASALEAANAEPHPTEAEILAAANAIRIENERLANAVVLAQS